MTRSDPHQRPSAQTAYERALASAQTAYEQALARAAEVRARATERANEQGFAADRTHDQRLETIGAARQRAHQVGAHAYGAAADNALARNRAETALRTAIERTDAQRRQADTVWREAMSAWHDRIDRAQQVENTARARALTAYRTRIGADPR